MLSIEDAVRILKENSPPIVETERIRLMEAPGRILAADIQAPMEQPPFARSPLDGYAIRSEDSKGASRDKPVYLEVIGEVCAGHVFRECVGHNQAVRIMTGAPIPKGADTVIRQENTDYGEKTVAIYEQLRPFSNYCEAGEDYHRGECLLKRGSLLDGISMGVLAGAGLTEVPVYRQPQIGLISTGDEVMMPGEALPSGKIYNSNLYLIGGRLKELGMTPVFMEHCSDCAEHMANLIRCKMQSVDLLVTTGGVSVGKKDIMHAVIRILSARQLFWKVAVKPGAPVLAAVCEGKLLICLSGNPFGAAANFELLVRPILAAMSGNDRIEMSRLTAVFNGDFRKSSMGRRFLRGYYKDGQVCIPEEKHAAGVLSSMVGCNCMIDIEAGNPGLHHGDQVQVLLF